MYAHSTIGKWFITFLIEHNNKLVQHFQKEKREKDIYEVNGSFGHQTPTRERIPSETSNKESSIGDDILEMRFQFLGNKFV